MEKNFWQEVMDGMDKDITDPAAERLNCISDKVGDEDYTGDCKPTVYSFPKRSAGHRKGLFIGIGSAAAAAAVGLVLLRIPQSVPVSEEPAGKTSAAELVRSQGHTYSSDVGSHEIIDSAELLNSYTRTEGFDELLFDTYFCGVWSNDEESITLSYSEADGFGLMSGYVCGGFLKTEKACSLIAEYSGGFDVWSVPLEEPETLVVYRNASIDGSSITGEKYRVFSAKAEPAESSWLSYFGQERFAAETGLSAQEIFCGLSVDFNGTEYSSRMDSDEWDNVLISGWDGSERVLTMPFSASGGDASSVTYLDTVWSVNSDGKWEMTHALLNGDMFARTAQQLHTVLTTSDLDVFEMYFSGRWTEKTTGEDITLTYSEDLFSPTEKCGGFYAERDGWCMYRMAGNEVSQVYYIPYSEPDSMYLYLPDSRGHAAKEAYAAEFSHTMYGALSSGTKCSTLGFERYRLDLEFSGEQELFDKVVSEIYEISGGFSAAAYSEDIPWEGYRMYRNAAGSLEISYQVYDGMGHSKWVTKLLEKTAAGWQSTMNLDNTKLADSEPANADEESSVAVEVINGGQSDN